MTGSRILALWLAVAPAAWSVDMCTNVTNFSGPDEFALRAAHPGSYGWQNPDDKQFYVCWPVVGWAAVGTNLQDYPFPALNIPGAVSNLPNPSWNPNVTDTCQAVVSVEQFSSNAVNQLVGAQSVTRLNDLLVHDTWIRNVAYKELDTRSWTGVVNSVARWTNMVGLVDPFLPAGVRTSILAPYADGGYLSNTLNVVGFGAPAADALDFGYDSNTFDVDLTRFAPVLVSPGDSAFNGVLHVVPSFGGIGATIGGIRSFFVWLCGIAAAIWGFWRMFQELEMLGQLQRGKSGINPGGAVPLVNIAFYEGGAILVCVGMFALGWAGLQFYQACCGVSLTSWVTQHSDVAPVIRGGAALIDAVIPVDFFLRTLVCAGGLGLILRSASLTFLTLMRLVPF